MKEMPDIFTLVNHLTTGYTGIKLKQKSYRVCRPQLRFMPKTIKWSQSPAVENEK